MTKINLDSLAVRILMAVLAVDILPADIRMAAEDSPMADNLDILVDTVIIRQIYIMRKIHWL
jgi:hypothetical protein